MLAAMAISHNLPIATTNHATSPIYTSTFRYPEFTIRARTSGTSTRRRTGIARMRPTTTSIVAGHLPAPPDDIRICVEIWQWLQIDTFLSPMLNAPSLEDTVDDGGTHARTIHGCS